MSCGVLREPFRVIFVNDTRFENHFGCELVVSNLVRVISDLGGVVEKFVSLKDFCHADQILFEYKELVDLVIINGEGTLHSNRKVAFDLLTFVSVSDKYKIPCVVLNATFQGNSKELYDLLSEAMLVVVRESESIKELDECGADVDVAPDAIFFTEIPAEMIAKSKRPREGIKILVSDSVLPGVTLELEQFRRELKGDTTTIFFADSYADWTINFFRRFPRRYFLRPAYAFRYLMLLPRQLFSMKSDFASFCLTLRKADLVITGRFHLVCLLIMLNIPFVAVESNTKKISSLLKDIGLKSRVVMSVEELRVLYRDSSNELSSFSSDEMRAIREYKEYVFMSKIKLRARLLSVLSSRF